MVGHIEAAGRQKEPKRGSRASEARMGAREGQKEEDEAQSGEMVQRQLRSSQRAPGKQTRVDDCQ